MGGIAGNATLQAEQQGLLRIDDVVELEKGTLRATFMVRSDWYTATVVFETSVERLKALVDSLNSVLAAGSGGSVFINEDGNVDLKVEVSRLGHVFASGILCKDMGEDIRVRFGLRTDRYSLDTFTGDLQQILTQY